MKFNTRYKTIQTKHKREYVNISGFVEDTLAESGISGGMVLVSAMHITAGVWVNDAEYGLLDLGPWQQVYYAEFDGRRPKRVIVKVMGE